MPDDRAFAGSSLCVVGNVNRDIKTAPMRAGDHLFADGETSVASIAETIGGGGANSAFAAASLGARVAFLGKVGADPLGDRLERTLTKYGLAAHLARAMEHASGTSIALSFDTGHRHFISSLPANEALCFSDLDLDAVRGCQHLLRADLWFSQAMLFEGNQALFQAARKSGIPVSIDLNWDPQWGRASSAEIRARKQAVRDILPSVSLAHGNIRELTEFADAPDLDTALRSLADWGAEAVAVHLGSKGAGYYHQGSLVTAPPAPVKSPLHATGTGDVLSVCLMLLHHRQDIPILDRLHLANSIVAEFMEGKRRLIPPLAD
ncbi:MAG TPA: carbohydrate kinase family protein [Chthoniobacter sp.]|jgi:sugar/nucleoside kinase (ribokinase family)